EALVPFLEEALASSTSELVFPGRDGRMRSPEADPQKVLRTALARAGLVDYWVHTCRRYKRRGEPHSERHADGELRPCPRCAMKLWPTAKVRPMRFHDLRHSTATLLLRERVDATRVQRLLRHPDVKTTTARTAISSSRTCARRSTCFRRRRLLHPCCKTPGPRL